MISIITSTKSLDCSIVTKLVEEYSLLKEAGVDFELIVQDCASDPVLIKELAMLTFTSVQSEQDSGIYDAWNKALPRVRGDKVCFLGVDDTPIANWFLFADKFTLNNDEVIVCDVNYKNNEGHITGTFKNPDGPTLDMRLARWLHPGFIFSSLIYKNNKFKSKYKIISDGIFYAQMPFAKVKSHYTQVGVLMTIGGTSNSPLGARKRFHEYIEAFISNDIDKNLKMFNRFILSNLPQYILSFTPSLYNVVQHYRMKFKYKILQ